jgi:hypothetical protein
MGPLEWTAIGVTVTVLATIGGIVVRLTDRINKSEAKADAAGTAATESRADVERLEAAVVEFRVAVAKEYVSKDTLATFETRVLDAINRLTDRFDQLLTTTRT